MKLLHNLVLSSVIWLMSHSVWAQTATDALAFKLNKLRSMQAHFEQQVLDGKGQVMQQSAGQFALLRPGKFRWETDKPTKQLLIADGTQIWVYDQDLQQVTVQQQDNRSVNSPAMLLSGSVLALKKNFQVMRLNKPAAEGVWFTLKPISQDAMFQAVELNFKDDALHAMRLVDNLGQVSMLRFSQVINNPTISAHQFHFKAPKGVDVIDQRRIKR